MIARLAFRNIVLRPWRSAFLLVGYSLGVSVMIVLLSIGEALLAQAREEKLVGGGDVTVLPEGIDIEVLKTGGVGGMFFSIDHARFVYQQLLASPRYASAIADVSPQVEGKLLYARTMGGRETPVIATGEIPSATMAVGALPPLAAGQWRNDSFDHTWIEPDLKEFRDAIDHFHLPPDSARRNPTWAEWHYFNVLSSDTKRWAFVSFIVAGEIPNGDWGGQILVTLHTQGRGARKFVATVPASVVRFSTSNANLSIGTSNVTILDDGRYAVRARAREVGGTATVDVNLLITPAARAYFPGAALSTGETISGYVVPGLRAEATGSICVDARCEKFDGARAYHDHNWGVWRGVTWEWGAARAGEYSVLYGRVQPADSTIGSQPLFVYVVDSLGFLALFRPKAIRYDDSLHVPHRAEMVDVRGDDALRIELTIEDAMMTDTRTPGVERGEGLTARRLDRPFFVQMKGRMRISGRVRGKAVNGEGSGFFETYR